MYFASIVSCEFLVILLLEAVLDFVLNISKF